MSTGLASGEAPRAITDADIAALLALNNAHATELSWQSPEAFSRLLAQACFARTAGEAEALLIALDQTADYDNPNFAWLAARYPRFVYIDRIVVAEALHGRGLARGLYAALIRFAAAHGHTHLVCEINLDPPNPASLALHVALGFSAVGQATLDNGKTVAYFHRPLSPG
ncbi:GNAT family N-acetyltransferase [Stenotrophomonas sp. YIM B06876]|uniref:GNAT family N-acetyltransferase n=1 Tax=Stenotrophomonas sp. YIM B06876 TaxID=3060211 RepID=UPI002739CF32|nr:GNAT family N-acetyltransferase [Stenotrophomonas sp. YIM B06876]